MEVPVFKNGQQLSNPWTGGMNAPQWALFDINHDGVKDLYAFDRNGNVHLSFINIDNSPGSIHYQYSRYWLKNFPEVRDFVLMRDFNNDGLPDLFASSHDEYQVGLKVYKASLENGFLKYDRIAFPEYSHDIIPYVDNGEIIDQIRIWLHLDYPAINDVDGDGDLDILTIGQGGNKISFYKNISLENNFSTDTLLFEWSDDCWGRFGILPDTQSLSLSLDPNMCVFYDDPEDAFDRNNPHGGTALNFFDADADGDKEILYGDLISPNIIFGKNNGNENAAWVTEQDAIFPSYNDPINIPYFPATFFLDINKDNARDLIVSPNQIWTSPDIQTAWYYENSGSDEFPEFNFIKKDFLADGMLDFGTGANPVFVDVNADNLIDIVVGNKDAWAEGMGAASLYLLINIGSVSSPVFELVDEDWLGLGQYFPAINAMSPTFGDMDDDGDDDLLLGKFNGNVHYAENIAGPGNTMQFNNFQFNWKEINVGKYSTPFIHDINKDGLPDLIIGELKGTVNYFPNIGTASNPDFHPIVEESPNNDYFGKINTQSVGATVGYSQPVVLDFDNEVFIVSGSFRGWLKRYKIDVDSLGEGAFELLDEYFGEIREGSISRISFANINGSNYMDAMVGNDRGGLTLFQSSITVDGLVDSKERAIPQKKLITIYPNPTSGVINIENAEDSELSIFDIYGKIIYFEKNMQNSTSIDLTGNISGIYFIKLKKENQVIIKKVILSK